MTARRSGSDDSQELPGPVRSGDAIAGAQISSRAGETEETSVPAAEAEAAAGADATGNADIWEAYDQALAAATRERDRALDKATTRLASVTAGGYLEYDRSVSLAWAAYESASHNARLAHAAAPR